MGPAYSRALYRTSDQC